jgi:fructose-1,6-bisphosphatase/inositol monophosphatase family enzyme
VSTQLEAMRELLCALQNHIRDALIQARDTSAAENFAEVAHETLADTIYQIDKISEDAILSWFHNHWPATLPIELVMEGIEDEAVTFPRGTSVEKTQWKCILDPIDGTRGLMYDKRAAWSLAAIAPQRGTSTHIGDIQVAAMTELPTSKQWRADQISAVKGCGKNGVVAQSINVQNSARTPLRLRPFQDFFPKANRCWRNWKKNCGTSFTVWAAPPRRLFSMINTFAAAARFTNCSSVTTACWAICVRWR